MTPKSLLLLSTSPLALTVALTAPAAAQSAYDAPLQLPSIAVEGAASSGAGSYKADLPTLPKLTEPLLDTPQTINVVPRQLIDDQGVTTFRDALRNVPGISLAAGEAGAQGDNVTIRGFTARNDIYLDGMRDFGSYYRDPFNIEDLQVLKGPASILFGKGSTGGVIEQDSKRPSLTPFTNSTVSFGTDGTKRVTADVNRPLPEHGEGAALRINVMGHDSEVVSGRPIGENSRFGIAPTLALGLGTPTRLTLSFLHQTEYDIPDYGVPYIYSATPVTPTAIARPALLSLTNSKYYGFERGNYLRTNADVATAKLEHDFDNSFTVSDQMRFAHYVRQFDITEGQLFTAASAATPGASGVTALIVPGTPLSSLSVSRNQLYGHSLETYLVNDLDATKKFTTGPVEHTLRAGIEVGRETSDPVRFTTIGPYSQTPLLDPNPSDVDNARTYLSSRSNTSARTVAAYALDTIKLNEQWELRGGLRWDRFAADFNQAVFPNPVTGAGANQLLFAPVDYMLSWRAAVVYKPTPNGSVYFDAGTSFDPSAEALSLSATTGPLSPVKNRSFEVGTKWDLMDGRMTVTGALFYTNQFNVREPDPNNPLVNILAGDAVAKGGEIQAAGHITETVKVVAGYAYTYSIIDKSPVTGAASDLGHRLANTPAHTGNLWAEWESPWKVEFGAGVNAVSSRYAATTPTTAGGVAFFKEAPGYWTLSAMAKYPINDHVTAQLNLTNLTDNKYYDQLHPSHVVPGGGRTALLTVSFKY